MKGRRGGTLRAAACLLATALLAATLLAGCGQGGKPGGAPRASITISSYFPPTINGRNFRPGEHVVLLAQPRLGGLKPFYFRLHARSDGTFVARLHGYGLDRCTGFTVTATGSRGSRAVVRSPQFGCPPVQSPVDPGQGVAELRRVARTAGSGSSSQRKSAPRPEWPPEATGDQ